MVQAPGRVAIRPEGMDASRLATELAAKNMYTQVTVHENQPVLLHVPSSEVFQEGSPAFPMRSSP